MKSGLFFLCAALALGGCSTGKLLESTEPKPTVYSLRPIPPESTASNQAARIIEILAPSVPPGMNRDRIALALDGGQKLDYFATAHWSAPLEDIVEDFTRRSVSAVLPYVVAVTSEQAIDPDYKLQIKINEFQPEYPSGPESPPLLKANVEFTLVRFSDDTIMTSFVLSKQEALADNRLDLIVVGLERLLQEIEREAFFKIGDKITPQEEKQ